MVAHNASNQPSANGAMKKMHPDVQAALPGHSELPPLRVVVAIALVSGIIALLIVIVALGSHGSLSG